MLEPKSVNEDLTSDSDGHSANNRAEASSHPTDFGTRSGSHGSQLRQGHRTSVSISNLGTQKAPSGLLGDGVELQAERRSTDNSTCRSS